MEAAVDAQRAPIQLPHAAADALAPTRICSVVSNGGLACPSSTSVTCDHEFTLMSKKIAVKMMSAMDRRFMERPSPSDGGLR